VKGSGKGGARSSGMREGAPGVGSPAALVASGAALTPFERVQRVRARSWVLQILYAWESQVPRLPLEEAMEGVFRIRRVAPKRETLVRRHMRYLAEHMEEIDRTIQDAMDNWRLDRLSRVDRSVLRLAVAELLFAEDVPQKVAIQEGVRLAGQYGGEESHRFVNGVLDAIYRAARRDGSARSE